MKNQAPFYFKFFFKQYIRNNNSEIKFNNSFIIDDINNSFLMESSIEEAKQIFKKIYPDSEFLPPLKDPNEEDVYDRASKILGIDVDDENEKNIKK